MLTSRQKIPGNRSWTKFDAEKGRVKIEIVEYQVHRVLFHRFRIWRRSMGGGAIRG